MTHRIFWKSLWQPVSQCNDIVKKLE